MEHYGIDYTVSIGNILTIFSVIGSVMALLYNMKGDISIVKHDIHYLQESHKALTEAFAQLGRVLTQVAVQDQRMNMLEKRLDELAHGEGIVLKK
jgi:DNA repair ATPase RecN